MVTPLDFNTHLYDELIEAIDRNDEDILNDAIASAEGQAMGYLSRYDTDALFSAVDGDRDPTLLMYLKDMAVWHFIALANPNTDVAMRKTRFDDAIGWLKDIQSGKIVQKKWPLEVEEKAEYFFKVDSAPKRETRY